jgi:phage/plasmid primase-like uncharacterized protein
MGTVKNIFDFNDAPLQHQVREEPVKDPLREFRRAMADGGYIVSGEIIEDSRIHRFDGPEDKSGKKSAWYVFYPDRIPAGAWGSWKTDETITWCAKAEREMTPQERADHHTRIERVRAARDDELAKVHAEAREKGQEVWEAAPEVLVHPYLEKKGISALGLRLHQGRLLIPMRDSSGVIQSYQTIAADGEKRFLSGGAKKGNFFTIPGEGKTAVAEGYATAASIHMATGWTVLVAFDAGNLRPVAEAWKKEHPSGEIVICGDNDATSVGQAKAKKAAEAVTNCWAVWPPEVGMDWNDVHKAAGISAVMQQLVPEEDEIQTFEDLYEMDFVHDPIIEGLLDQKESLLLTGRCGLGKSLFALNLAMELARDKFNNSMDFNDNRLFEQFPITKSYNCLFIQSENTAKATNRRLRKIVNAKPEYKHCLRRISAPKIRGDIRMTGFLSSDEFRTRVMQLIKKTKADVVFLDPLISYHDGDENDNAEMRRNLDRITEIMDLTDVSFVVVHHVGKAQNVEAIFAARGATAVADWAANFLALSWAKSEKLKTKQRIIVVEHAKARNFEIVRPFFLDRGPDLVLRPVKERSTEDGRPLHEVLIEKIVAEVRRREDAGEILLTIKNLGDVFPGRWKTEIPGATRANVRAAAEAAILDGVLFEVSGRNKMGKEVMHLSAEKIPAKIPAEKTPAIPADTGQGTLAGINSLES